MNEDEPTMTPDEIRDACVDDIIRALGYGRHTITRAEIYEIVKDESLWEELRIKIAEVDEIEDALALCPGKSLTTLINFHKLNLSSFD